jgi:mRNA interferase RelE/StbE
VAAYRPVIAPAAAERIRHLPPELKRAVREAIRALSGDPALGEPLERELSKYRKFRVRRYRLVYRIDRAARTFTVVAVGHRRSVYEELAERIRSG